MNEQSMVNWRVAARGAARVVGATTVLCVGVWATSSGSGASLASWLVVGAWLACVWLWYYVEDCMHCITDAINDPATWRTSTWQELQGHLLAARLQKACQRLVDSFARWWRQPSVQTAYERLQDQKRRSGG